jgi:endonuclease III
MQFLGYNAQQWPKIYQKRMIIGRLLAIEATRQFQFVVSVFNTRNRMHSAQPEIPAITNTSNLNNFCNMINPCTIALCYSWAIPLNGAQIFLAMNTTCNSLRSARGVKRSVHSSAGTGDCAQPDGRMDEVTIEVVPKRSRIRNTVKPERAFVVKQELSTKEGVGRRKKLSKVEISEDKEESREENYDDYLVQGARKSLSDSASGTTVRAPDIEGIFNGGPSPRVVRDTLFAAGLAYDRSAADGLQPSVLDSLFATILSQATTNVNSSRAFQRLKERFPNGWDAALRAGPEEIEDAIRCAGLANRKAARMHEILEQINSEREVLSLEHLRSLDDETVKLELRKFKGVGPKTAACVCMFNLARPEMPVDTHVHRISQRLGWILPGTSPEATYDLLNNAVPDDCKYTLHVQLVQHGRTTCRPANPKCSLCPLRTICPSSRSMSTKHAGQSTATHATT